jgi:hypothetical protein
MAYNKRKKKGKPAKNKTTAAKSEYKPKRKGPVPQDIVKQLNDMLADKRIVVSRVDEIHFKPHVFGVTDKHMEYARDHCKGVLSGESIMKYERLKGKPAPSCGHVDEKSKRKCNHLYEDHTFDRGVVFYIQNEIDGYHHEDVKNTGFIILADPEGE